MKADLKMAEDFLTEAFISLKGRLRAEDALQDAFCRLWGRKYEPQNLKSAIGLLSRTVRNIEIDEYRKGRQRRTVSIEDRQIPDESEAALEKEALFRKVEASLDEELTPLQKKIVRMHEYEGTSFEQIARKFGMQPAAVRMQISRARKTLREKFRKDNEGL